MHRRPFLYLNLTTQNYQRVQPETYLGSNKNLTLDPLHSNQRGLQVDSALRAHWECFLFLFAFYDEQVLHLGPEKRLMQNHLVNRGVDSNFHFDPGFDQWYPLHCSRRQLHLPPHHEQLCPIRRLIDELDLVRDR